MAFRFQSSVTYERLQLFVKDLFSFTGSLPSYERPGLIDELRRLGTSLLEDFAGGHTRTGGDDVIPALDRAITTVAKIAALIDLCAQLSYTTPYSHKRWVDACEDLTKNLYSAKKSLK